MKTRSPGELRRFQNMIAEEYLPVMAYVRRRAREADVADLTQKVFLTAYRRLGEMPGEGVHVWLLQFSRRELSNYWRSNGRRLKLEEKLSFFSPRMAEQESDGAREDVMVAFHRLRAGDQEVIRLALWDKLRHSEAAALLGCSESAFNVRLYRAILALRAEFADVADPSETGERSDLNPCPTGSLRTEQLRQKVTADESLWTTPLPEIPSESSRS